MKATTNDTLRLPIPKKPEPKELYTRILVDEEIYTELKQLAVRTGISLTKLIGICLEFAVDHVELVEE